MGQWMCWWLWDVSCRDRNSTWHLELPGGNALALLHKHLTFGPLPQGANTCGNSNRLISRVGTFLGNLWSSNMSVLVQFRTKKIAPTCSNPVVSFVDVSLLKPHHVQQSGENSSCKTDQQSGFLSCWQSLSVWRGLKTGRPEVHPGNRRIEVSSWAKSQFWCVRGSRPVCKLKAVLAVIRYRHYIQSLWINKWINKFIS